MVGLGAAGVVAALLLVNGVTRIQAKLSRNLRREMINRQQPLWLQFRMRMQRPFQQPTPGILPFRPWMAGRAGEWREPGCSLSSCKIRII